MKKVMVSLVSMVMCLTMSAAMAEYTPSKTKDDLTHIDVQTKNVEARAEFFIRPVKENEPAYKELWDACQTEVEKMVQSGALEDYFGAIVNTDGAAVDLKKELGVKELHVYEMYPIIAGGYDEAFGAVKTEMHFPTSYNLNKKVKALIGLVTVNADHTQSVQWVAYDAAYEESASGEGHLAVEFEPETILAIQNGMALLAIVSD